MRKTIILGSILALAGFSSIALASDRSKLNDQDATRVQRQVSDDGRSEQRDRNERKDRSRERHDESSEQHESRDTHNETDGRRDRR